MIRTIQHIRVVGKFLIRDIKWGWWILAWWWGRGISRKWNISVDERMERQKVVLFYPVFRRLYQKTPYSTKSAKDYTSALFATFASPPPSRLINYHLRSVNNDSPKDPPHPGRRTKSRQIHRRSLFFQGLHSRRRRPNTYIFRFGNDFPRESRFRGSFFCERCLWRGQEESWSAERCGL